MPALKILFRQLFVTPPVNWKKTFRQLPFTCNLNFTEIILFSMYLYKYFVNSKCLSGLDFTNGAC